MINILESCRTPGPCGWKFLLPVLCLTMVLGSACATLEEKKLLKDGLVLTYRHQSSLGSPGKDFHFQHPAEITEDQVRTQLLSLTYEDMSLMSKKRYVFREKDVDRMSRLLTKALNRATATNFIHFTYNGGRGMAEADLFKAGGRLHWRFTKIRGRKYTDNPNPVPGYGRALTNWRLVPRAGQSYFGRKKFLGNLTRENWIMADIDMPPARKMRPEYRDRAPDKATPASRKPIKAKTPPASPPGLEEKLRFLKQLHDKKLIDDAEYKRKRRELMDKYM